MAAPHDDESCVNDQSAPWHAEAEQGLVRVKNLGSGEQVDVPFADIAGAIKD